MAGLLSVTVFLPKSTSALMGNPVTGLIMSYYWQYSETSLNRPFVGFEVACFALVTDLKNFQNKHFSYMKSWLV